MQINNGHFGTPFKFDYQRLFASTASKPKTIATTKKKPKMADTMNISFTPLFVSSHYSYFQANTKEVQQLN
ncbi:hypothetical protein LG275_06415 [Chryseomicrobium palamuruense]